MKEIKATKTNMKSIIKSSYLKTTKSYGRDEMIDEFLELFYKKEKKTMTLPVDRNKVNRFRNVEKYRYENGKLYVIDIDTDKVVEEYKLIPSKRTKAYYLKGEFTGSNAAEPIRDIEKIKEIENLLKSDDNWRDLALFILGINFGLRIDDMTNIKVKDLVNQDGTIKEYFDIIEGKTGKQNTIKINKKSKKVLELLFENTGVKSDPNNYILFNTRANGWDSPISRVSAYNALKKVFDRVGLKGNYSCHTTRKTGVYHLWKSGVEIELLQAKLNHASVETTRRYLGISSGMIAETFDKLDDIF